MCTNTTSKNKSCKGEKTDKIMYGMGCNCLKYFILTLRTYIDMFIDYAFSFFWEKRQTVPELEPEHKILTESAVSLAKKIRTQQLRSEDLVKACIERIKQVNKVVNAMTDERFEDALKEAREVDKMIAEGVSELYFEKKPFLGVPFTAKESHAVSGLLHTLGIVARKHVRAHSHAKCVQLLVSAGAIPLAVTNVPEINKWQETRNLVFGQTNNPYHTGRTVGGSSGGEAALMASIATPIALCSDIGGSTRMPAFYCGLFGHNPTAGTTSLEGSGLRSGKDDSMASIGFVSRHSEDLAPLTCIVADEKADLLNLGKKRELKNVRFYYLETATDMRVSCISPDLRKAMSDVISKLREELPDDKAPTPFQHEGFSHMFQLWKYHMSKESENFPKLLTNNTGTASGVVELVKKVFGLSQYTLAAIMKLLDEQVLPTPKASWAEPLTQKMRKDLTDLLGVDGVLLCPSAPQPAPYHYSCFLRPFNFAYWGVWNALRFPATQVPLGLNEEGLPLGIQIVASPNNDGLCLNVAKHFEKLFGGYVPPCAVVDKKKV